MDVILKFVISDIAVKYVPQSILQISPIELNSSQTES